MATRTTRVIRDIKDLSSPYLLTKGIDFRVLQPSTTSESWTVIFYFEYVTEEKVKDLAPKKNSALLMFLSFCMQKNKKGAT